MLLIVKNGKWASTVGQRPLYHLGLQLMKSSLFLCQEIIRKNSLRKPSSEIWVTRARPGGGSPVLVVNHGGVDTKSSPQIKFD